MLAGGGVRAKRFYCGCNWLSACMHGGNVAALLRSSKKSSNALDIEQGELEDKAYQIAMI